MAVAGDDGAVPAGGLGEVDDEGAGGGGVVGFGEVGELGGRRREGGEGGGGEGEEGGGGQEDFHAGSLGAGVKVKKSKGVKGGGGWSAGKALTARA